MKWREFERFYDPLTESDVRMVADENLNRMTRSLGESNLGKLQVELYKEIKKNGSQRCVRAALTRFSGLAKYIRSAKCRPYLVNLLPCLDVLSKRSEEQVSRGGNSVGKSFESN